jgi:hypothetical protein
MIGNMGTIRGKVANASDHTGPVIVYRYTKKEGVFSLESKVPADEQGGYRFGVSPGTYFIAAFIDIDQDSVLHQDERWNFYGKPSEITVAAGQTVTLETLTITNVPPVLPEGTKYENRLMLSVANIGRVVSLNDPLFNRGNHSLGMWRPLDFLDQIGGGLFFLQDYERDKIPVVLVHGVNGGPDDLNSIIDIRKERQIFSTHLSRIRRYKTTFMPSSALPVWSAGRPLPILCWKRMARFWNISPGHNASVMMMEKWQVLPTHTARHG